MKIKRKIHNNMFPHRQLMFFEHSKVSEQCSLDCYIDKWFLILMFIPLLIVVSFFYGVPTTFKALLSLFTEPSSSDFLTLEELKKLNYPL